jgi:hypothetical protein
LPRDSELRMSATYLELCQRTSQALAKASETLQKDSGENIP